MDYRKHSLVRQKLEDAATYNEAANLILDAYLCAHETEDADIAHAMHEWMLRFDIDCYEFLLSKAAFQKLRTLHRKAKKSTSDRSYRLRNPETIKAGWKRTYAAKKDEIIAYQRKYYNDPANQEKIQDRRSRYYQKNKEDIKQKVREYERQNQDARRKRSCNYVKKRRDTDMEFRMLCTLRGRLRNALKKRGIRKEESTMDLTGCTKPFLLKWIEDQFTDGMSWDNMGRGGWHIDHILPCASFDLNDPEQRKQCFHYTNLRPLWQFDNIAKGTKIEPNTQPELALNLT